MCVSMNMGDAVCVCDRVTGEGLAKPPPAFPALPATRSVGAATAAEGEPAVGRPHLLPAQLAGEVEITWLRPVETLPRYIRERLDTFASFRRRPWRHGYDGVVGYSVLGPQARSEGGGFARRVFWLADHDPYDGGGCPCEAVDPLTIRPGEPGLCTARCSDPAATPLPTGPATIKA